MSNMFKSLIPICSKCEQECIVVDLDIKEWFELGNEEFEFNGMNTIEVSECCSHKIMLNRPPKEQE